MPDRSSWEAQQYGANENDQGRNWLQKNRAGVQVVTGT